MTEQEVINNQLKTKIDIQDEKFNMFMNEMRDRDNQRAEDMREIRASVSSIRTLTFTTIVAIAAMVVTILLK